jgi:hypothetical protein
MLYKRYSPLGVNLDIDPIRLDDTHWTEAGNMVPRPGAMERARGYSEIYASPAFPPTFLLATPQLGVPYWLYAGTNKIGIINNSNNHIDVTPAELTSAVAENSWSGGNLNGIAVINAVENPAFYWFNGVGDTAKVLPGLRTNTRYSVMRPFKYHLIGLGVSGPGGDFGDALHWSDAADPGQVPDSWVPEASNEAGDNILADESGNIIDGLTLRDSFYIYKQDSVYEMSYTGGPSVFRFRKVFGSTGVLTRNCVVRVKGTHVVLGNGDIYQHDGQNTKSIVDGLVRDSFFATIDDTSFANSFVVYLEPREEVWFCVPTTGSERPNLALVWNVTTGQWGYRAIPAADFAASGVVGEVQTQENWEDDNETWNSDTTRWLNQTFNNTEDSILLADSEKQKLFLANNTVTADGENYRVTVGKLGMSLDDPQHEKAIRRIWPIINAPQDTTFTLELFNQRDPQAPIEQVSVQQFQPGRNGVAVNVNARYLGMRIYSDDAVEWDIAGFDVGYMQRGRF